MFQYTLEYPQHDPEFLEMCLFIDSIGDSYASLITNYIIYQRHLLYDQLLDAVANEVSELIVAMMEATEVDDAVNVYCTFLNDNWSEQVLPKVVLVARVLMKYYLGAQLPETLEPSMMALNHIELSPRTLLCTLE